MLSVGVVLNLLFDVGEVEHWLLLLVAVDGEHVFVWLLHVVLVQKRGGIRGGRRFTPGGLV